MMNVGDVHALSVETEGKYSSSDEKIAVVQGNSVKATGKGDCLIYSHVNDRQTVFAHITVGWQVQNPVLPYSWRMYIPDSEVHNFGGKLYVYGSLDASNVFCSPHYMSLTTADLKRWDSYGYSVSSTYRDTDMPFPGRILWDSDGHCHNGKYFLYGFFEWRAGEENYTFVMESDSPMGKFKNFRWVVGDRSGKPVDGISTEVFLDDDGRRYSLYAPTMQPVSENYPVIARLIDDNVIDESSVTRIDVKDFYEAPSLRKRGDTYYFVYAENCGKITDANRTPKRLSYATAKNIFGPYTYRGVIITVEDLQGNVNIQGSIEQFGGEWYVFYHRALNGVWNKRSLCVEKLSFTDDGLIVPVSPTSSGFAENGLNTANPIWFNTAVVAKNCRFTDEGEYGSIRVASNAEIGFRHIDFTGAEKSITLQGKGLENIACVKVIANGRVIGERQGSGAIAIRNRPKGKTELVIAITALNDVYLETLRFAK
jgi:hypothetical protein